MPGTHRWNRQREWEKLKGVTSFLKSVKFVRFVDDKFSGELRRQMLWVGKKVKFDWANSKIVNYRSNSVRANSVHT